MPPAASPAASASRRHFLRGRSSPAKTRVIRPPQSQPEEAFINSCTRCGSCIESCPTRIIVKGEGGFPQLDFLRGECTRCRACIDNCPSGALRPLENNTPLTSVVARMTIGSTCLAMNRVECRICETQCPEDAIRFRPRLGGVALPEKIEETCTGCGACYAPCPSRAITLEPLA